MTNYIKDPKTVRYYASQVTKPGAMLENLTEFFNSLPAPDENENIPGMSYGHMEMISAVHSHLIESSEITDEMFEATPQHAKG